MSSNVHVSKWHGDPSQNVDTTEVVIRLIQLRGCGRDSDCDINCEQVLVVMAE